MAIRTLHFDEYGRIERRTEEPVDETHHYGKYDGAGAKQVTTEWKGKQRRPAATAFARHFTER